MPHLVWFFETITYPSEVDKKMFSARLLFINIICVTSYNTIYSQKIARDINTWSHKIKLTVLVLFNSLIYDAFKFWKIRLNTFIDILVNTIP